MIDAPQGIPILLVEDDEMQSRVASAVITQSAEGQYSVTRCTSVAEALEYLGYLKIGAVLLDLELPDSSGLSTLTTIAQQYPEVPIIILTGTDNNAIALESLKRGAEDYIVKGQFNGHQLCRALSHAIERKKNEIEMKRLQNMLQQERRLEALGAIASGVAHEINTPLQFIGTNLEFIREVFGLIEKAVSPLNSLPPEGSSPDAYNEAARAAAAALTQQKLIALRKEVPKSLNEAVDGIQRVKRIISAMNVFARTVGPKKSMYDVNKAVRDALTITRHEWKNVATTELYLDENLPTVPCYPEELSHCLLNLLVNAVHAIEDARAAHNTKGEKGLITISTRAADNALEIRIGDSGIGIPKNIQHRIFEPFFTTKAVGRGSGQGLSSVYQMIVRHMGGRVSFDSYEDQGSVFKITLPLHDSESSAGSTLPERS